MYDYTSGYPFLVSRLCKLIDEEVSEKHDFASKRAAWTREGFYEAIRMILLEKNTLFESLIGKLTDYPELNEIIRTLLFTGKSIAYNSDNPAVDIAGMFGFIKNHDGKIAVSNRVFETRLYNLYLLEEEIRDNEIQRDVQQDKNQFIENGHLINGSGNYYIEARTRSLGRTDVIVDFHVWCEACESSVKFCGSHAFYVYGCFLLRQKFSI